MRRLSGYSRETQQGRDADDREGETGAESVDEAERTRRRSGAHLAPRLRRGGRPGPRHLAGHRRDAAEPRPGRLAELAAHPRRLGLQPARSDRPGQRRSAAARLGLAARAGAQSGGAARARRGDVHSQSTQHRAGGGRGDRGPHLGIQPGVRRVDRLSGFGRRRDADAFHRHLQRQDLRQHLGRPHRGARRGHRRGGLGPHRRRLPARLPLYERADRGQREHRLRHDRLPELQERRLLHFRP